MPPKRKSSDDVKQVSLNAKNKCLLRQPRMNAAYKEESFVKNLQEAFQNGKEFPEVPDVSFHKYPFTCCVLPKFLDDESFLKGLEEELLGMNFNDRNNDLNKFRQTNDFAKMKTPHVAALRSFLYEEVLEWLKEVTGISLTAQVDVASSRYEYTDVLLCHDDELEGRRIAYMLYLVPPWEANDGGALDLFDTKDGGEPNTVVKSILPQWNNFAFFEVSPKSFHQVAEIMTQDKCRLSVNGWFYGPPFDRPSQPDDPEVELEPALDAEADELSRWINPSYLDLETQFQIRSKFEEDSEIELPNFLTDSLHHQVAEELKDPAVRWEMLGPPNKRHCEVAALSRLPDTVQSCLRLFRSEPFFFFLSSLTGIPLHPLAENDNDQHVNEVDNGKAGPSGAAQSSVAEARDKDESTAQCCVALNRWRRGSYTLMYDSEDTMGYALDVRLFFNCGGWQNEMGGYTSYVVKGEDEELLTVCPSENSLALVCRDAETVSFVKYVNAQVEDLSPAEYHTITATYVE